jgi:FMN-dependent NADH-azoreductase
MPYLDILNSRGSRLRKDIILKVLLIDANPKTAEHSHSKWASDHYVAALKGQEHYVEVWPVGLLEGTFVHIQASGSVYSEMPQMEFGNRYISQVLSFMGLEEKLSLLIEGTNMGLFDRDTYQTILDSWIKEAVKEVM